MPEPPYPPKPRDHPFRRPRAESAGGAPGESPPESPASPTTSSSSPDLSRSASLATSAGAVELQATSNFSFLVGASHPEELVERAAALGLDAIAVTDRNSLAGIVRAHVAARDAGVRLVVGVRLDLTDGPSLLVYPTGPRAYAVLCRLLTAGKRRAEKATCRLTQAEVLGAAARLGDGVGQANADTLLAILVPPVRPHALDRSARDAVIAEIRSHAESFGGDRLSIAATPQHDGEDEERFLALASLSRRTGVPLAATNDVHYHVPERKPVQDVLTCIRHGCTLAEAGRRLWSHAERRLLAPAEIHERFAAIPRSVARARAVADRCADFDLDQLRYRYPEPDLPPGQNAIEHLRTLAFAGAEERYPDGVSDTIRERLDYELAIIADLGYEPYFLTVHDIVRFARTRGILCQGRGAAANSAVCFCLGLTSVDPARVKLLFERFVSRARHEPPDIDIDFEHERREEVIQYIYARYGRERAALTATVISYRGRSAIREVGTALGLSLDCVDRMAKNLDRWSSGGPDPERIREIGLDPDDPTIAAALRLTGEIIGFPRHLSQHVGGFVITRGPLCELVPVANAAMDDRTVIEWDKDDIEAMGMLKIDCLGLGMLTCIRKAFGMIERQEGRTISMATTPAEDPDVYDMICRADTIGVFQIESRAQMTMLPRLQPRNWYDLVIEVAIVRPGPIVGDMVHPFLRRRQGLEPIVYPSEAVREVLERTLGVPLFQEQAMALAVVAAGFTPEEADRLRRAMAAWKRRGDDMVRFGEKLISGMLERGYERDFAERVFAQLKGFSEYGFPESHAASFALIVYVSCWLKHHYPSVFLAAILNSQPMGFYAPAQLVGDAKAHGVDVRPVDVNFSGWDCRLESVPLHPVTGRPDARKAPVRLGLRMVRGLGEEDARRIDRAVRERGPFHSIEPLWRASGVRVAALRALARADGFGSMGLDRQAAQWRLGTLRDETLPLFEPAVEAVAMGPEIEPPRARTEAGERDDELAMAATAVAAGHRAFAAPAGAIRTVSAATAIVDAMFGVVDEGMDEGVDAAIGRSTASSPPVEPEVQDTPVPSPSPSPAAIAAAEAEGDGPIDWLPEVAELTRVLQDYDATDLSLRSHPVAFLRPRLEAMDAVTAAEVSDAARSPHGRWVRVAGVTLVRQRPHTASGVTFVTIEDETGLANLIVRPHVFERDRRAARHGTIMLAYGTVEREGEVVHVMVRRLAALDGELAALRNSSRDFH